MVPIVATKMGAEGALALSGKNIVRMSAIEVNVVDTTGAGDSFDSGFLYGYLAGWELKRCLKLGVICGSLSTRAVGGIQAQASLDDALWYLYKCD